MDVKLTYFAWVRERIGLHDETYTTSATTAQELALELKERGENYSAAFHDLTLIRIAIDHEMAQWSACIKDAKEVAFFPPMTGG